MDEWDFDTLVSQLDKDLSGKGGNDILKTEDIEKLEEIVN
jgi:hypothetical protein